eukprot:295675_1
MPRNISGCSPFNKKGKRQVANVGLKSEASVRPKDKNDVKTDDKNTALNDRMTQLKTAESYRSPALCSVTKNSESSNDSNSAGSKSSKRSSTDTSASKKNPPKLKLSFSKRNFSIRKNVDIDEIQQNLKNLEELGEAAGTMHHRSSEVSGKSDNSLFDGIARGKGCISTKLLEEIVTSTGLSRSDPRLEKFFQRLDSIPNGTLKQAEFSYVISSNEVLIRRALTQSFIVPDWKEFCDDIKMIHDTVKDKTTGNVASYIPELAKVNPEFFAVSVCTIDGQTYSLGDDEENFCIQSC